MTKVKKGNLGTENCVSFQEKAAVGEHCSIDQLRLLHELLLQTMSNFMDFQSPQLFLYVCAFFILILNFFFFAVPNFMGCMIGKGLLVASFGIMLLLGVFLFTNVSQILINQVGQASLLTRLSVR